MRFPFTTEVPAPAMQKFTCVEFCRTVAVRSPGFSTSNATWIPGARPWPLPARGCAISERRRPFSGFGWLARRSISPSIVSLAITTAGQRSIGSGAAPLRSMKVALGSLMSASLRNRVGRAEPRLRALGMRKRPAQALRLGAAMDLDAERQVGDPHPHRLEDRETGIAGARLCSGDDLAEQAKPRPERVVVAHGLLELAREI